MDLSCARCSLRWRLSVRLPEPKDLLLRVRVAVSQERARSRQSPFHKWNLAWRNTVGPFLLQAGAGFASAVVLLGTVVLLVGIVTKPEAAQASGDEPLGNATAPRLLYFLSGAGDSQIAALPGPVVVEAYVNGEGAGLRLPHRLRPHRR